MGSDQTTSITLSDSLCDDEMDVLRYFIARGDKIIQELKPRSVTGGARETINAELDELRSLCQSVPPSVTFSRWHSLCQRYRSLAHSKATALNEKADVARTYESMDEFWADLEAQGEGSSYYTFWDSYESGRRRQLEKLLASTYGSETALLLNCGMSTIASVIGASKLCQGDVVVTGDRCYYETSEFLERYVVPTGVKVLRVPVNDSDRFLDVLDRARPKIALLETVTIIPSVPVLTGFHRWREASPETVFIIDNTVQSYLTRWFDIMKDDRPNLLVVESATKYLSEYCMAGVVYGSLNMVEQVRDYARTTGQQLQEKAFNYLSEADIILADWKLARHSRNVLAFRQVLDDYSSFFDYVNTLASDPVRNESTEIFSKGSGCLIFLAINPERINVDTTLEQAHKRLLNGWKTLVKASGMDLPVRAGYGGSETIARVYESGRINQPDAPTYLRVSVGVEPVEIIRSIAKSLGEAVKALCSAK